MLYNDIELENQLGCGGEHRIFTVVVKGTRRERDRKGN